jgi:hypothetical protein
MPNVRCSHAYRLQPHADTFRLQPHTHTHTHLPSPTTHTHTHTHTNRFQPLGLSDSQWQSCMFVRFYVSTHLEVRSTIRKIQTATVLEAASTPLNASAVIPEMVCVCVYVNGSVSLFPRHRELSSECTSQIRLFLQFIRHHEIPIVGFNEHVCAPILHPSHVHVAFWFHGLLV